MKKLLTRIIADQNHDQDQEDDGKNRRIVKGDGFYGQLVTEIYICLINWLLPSTPVCNVIAIDNKLMTTSRKLLFNKCYL